MSGRTQSRARALETITGYLTDNDIVFEQPSDDCIVATLPGEHRLKTTVSLVAGEHSLSLNAFVIRHPEENHAAFFRWLLERNLRIFGIAYALDHLGDVYLVGKVPLRTLTEDRVDQLLGAVLENSDGAFDHLLELGFESAIRREWQWRLSRGESTANLVHFQHLADPLSATHQEQLAPWHGSDTAG
ncbi:MAG: YbjN domain-containing protein [Actinomycetes bacterium]